MKISERINLRSLRSLEQSIAGIIDIETMLVNDCLTAYFKVIRTLDGEHREDAYTRLCSTIMKDIQMCRIELVEEDLSKLNSAPAYICNAWIYHTYHAFEAYDKVALIWMDHVEDLLPSQYIEENLKSLWKTSVKDYWTEYYIAKAKKYNIPLRDAIGVWR